MPAKKQPLIEKPPTHWARDVTGRDVEFAVEGFFPRGVVSSIYAPRDSGKTTVALHFLAELSRGRLFGEPHPRIRSLFNTQEDSLETVIKPRLEAHGADFGAPRDPHPLIAITAEPWTFPDDIPLLEAKLTQARDGGAAFDLVALDSVAQHLVRLNSIEPTTRAMTGLIEVAQEFDLAVLMIGHLTKSKGSTVESAIYGAGVLQNLSKGLFVYSRIPDEPEDTADEDGGTGQVEDTEEEESGLPRSALACERTGWGPPPPTVIFERDEVNLPAYRVAQPRLTYAGVSDLTAWQVKEFSKMSAKGSAAAEGKTEKARDWLIGTLVSKEARDEASGIDGAELRKQAKADGAFTSVNTWERGVALAKLQGVMSARRPGSNKHLWWIAAAPVADGEAE
jgi:RecA-family ATPase